jgi:hypothetical protein
MDSHASAEAYLDVRRRELARQSAAQRGVWHWYLLPMMPGRVSRCCQQSCAVPPRG